MLVSIVSVYYNREDFVNESIQSLLNQTYKNIEIIVVDDGSTDSTFEKLSNFNDPRLNVITHTNRGFVKSINKAISMAKGEVIAIHGSGDVSLPERINKQINYLKTHPEIGVIGCYCETKYLETGQSYIHAPKIEHTDYLKTFLKGNLFTHGEVMYRKQLFEKVGGYREFFKFTQDLDLWLRMSPFTHFHVIPEVLYERYVLPNGVSGSVEKRILQKFLGEYGRQCMEERVKNGQDFIDKHGNHGVFYRKRSKRLAKSLFELALFSMWNEDYKNARKINELGLNEKFTLRHFTLKYFLTIISSNKSMQKTSTSVINYLVKLKKG